MAEKSDYVVTLTREVIQEEKWLIKNETRKDAIWIAENMNQSKLYDCTLIEENEDAEDFETISAKKLFLQKEQTLKDFNKINIFGRR